MRKWIGSFRRWLHSHPAPRTAGNIFSSIGGGILVAWFIIDISSSGELVWKDALDTEATLYLAIYAVLVYLYYRDSYRFDRELRRWNEPEFREARLIQELWPYYIATYKKRIEEGDGLPNLEQVKKDIFGR